ncbi:MAG TPA: hypothetical protein DCL54_02920 [Alphaproteobacteria bacterium]|nr:hypothetical protein [Alphaproteobacteria bacterium]
MWGGLAVAKQVWRSWAWFWIGRMAWGRTIVAASIAAILAAPGAVAAPVVAGSGANAAASEAAIAAPKRGFFVGLQSGLVADSGLAPIVAGNEFVSLTPSGTHSLMANGYYVYTTEWSIGTYIGGGFGAFDLPLNTAGLTPSSMNLGYQGMAGVTYQFSNAMTLGLEYRYLNAVEQQSRIDPRGDQSETVSLRFDFAF